MDNTNSPKSPTSPVVIGLIIIAVICATFVWLQNEQQETAVPVVEPVAAQLPVVSEPEVVESASEPLDVKPPEPITQQPASELLAPESVLPQLDVSDQWIQQRLPEITWRKELLKLVIDDNMVRRFVVFTDNFARGTLAYEHSPLVAPTVVFTAIETGQLDTENQPVWHWDENTAKRFGQYVDLLRSFDIESLVAWYVEAKPLIDEAYQELGYPEGDFTQVLQQAISRVLDMEIPKEQVEIVRPSVMFKYKNPELESLDAADKLLLRLGKENLLVIKSVLLEVSDKLSRQPSNG